MFKSRNLSDLTEESETCNTDFPVVLWLVNDRADIQCRQSRRGLPEQRLTVETTSETSYGGKTTAVIDEFLKVLCIQL